MPAEPPWSFGAPPPTPPTSSPDAGPPSDPGAQTVPRSIRQARGGDGIVAWLERLGRVQSRRPWLVLGLALISVAVALTLASQLGFKTAFGELLPENKESVIIAREVGKRLPAVSTLTVVAEGSDNEGLKRFVDALVPELRAIDSSLVGTVDDGVKDTRAFFEKHKFLYAPLDLVQEIHDDIEERYNYEVHKKTGFILDEEEPPVELSEEGIRKRVEQKQAERDGASEGQPRWPDGYYLDEESHTIAVLIRTPVSSGDLKTSDALRAKVHEVIAKVDPAKYDRTIEIGLTGNLITSAEEYKRVTGDLAHVGVWGVVLILSVVFLFYLRIRTLVAMTLTVGIGTAWTFGLAYLLIGHLNTSTGFLFSIVVGNGINFGIIYMARYLEARRTRPPERSVFVAHRETWLSTLTAAAAATCAYGSLAVTDFRGFKHFGIIGGSGMLLCWIATYLFLPSILSVAERISPVKPPTGILAKLRGLYGRPFAFLVGRFPRAICLGAMLLTVGAGVLTYRFVVADDPMEYDMDNIANAPDKDESGAPKSAARRLGLKVDRIVGRQGQDGIAIMTDSVDQVLPLKAALDQRRDAAPADRKPFDKVVTIHSLLPTEQAPKIRLVAESRQLLEKARRKQFIGDEDWKKIEAYLPPKDMKPLGIADLPEQVARSFTEKDGTRGRLVYIVPATGRSVWDAHYLIEWAESFRETELPDGSVIKGSGHSVIFADLIMAVVEDAPKAIIVSLLSTLLIVLLAFRVRRSGVVVVGSVLVGLLWLVAILAIWRSNWGALGSAEFQLEPMRLNFLNFVALPITIGVGADYAVNVMQRHRLSGMRDVRKVIVETGGAVILCSLTTTLGYLALTLSINRAIEGFGVAAAAGEICCVLTGVLVLPALLAWRGRRQKAEASTTPAPARSAGED